MEDSKIIETIKKMIVDSPLGYFSRIFSNKNVELRDFVLKHSSFLDGKVDSINNKPYNKATRIVYAINGLTDYPRCATCNEPITRNIASYEDVAHLHCCNRCAQKDPNVVARSKATKLHNHGDPNYNNMSKNKKTCNERYGVDYAWQSNRTKEASKKSLLEHFGVDHPMKSKEVKCGMRQRYKEQHGVDHPFKDPNVTSKICAKNQANLGVDYPMQSKELHAVMHRNSIKTQKENFFYRRVVHAGNVEPMFGVEEWVRYAGRDYEHEFLWKCTKCGRVFKHKIMYGSPLFARCYECDPILSSTSHFEQEIVAFINSLGNGIEALNKDPLNKQIIDGKEIDIVVKKNGKVSLLIEADGLFWHSVLAGKDKFYHLNKTNKCKDIGYQLVHIFEDEWKFKKDIVMSRLKNLLGIHDKIIYARKCLVKEISSREGRDFFASTHIQGNCLSSIRLGLFYGNELVAAMSFGSRRKITNSRRVDGEYELLRFSTKLGYHVIGGAGKLLAAFERKFQPTKLVSYADRRWSVGKLYATLGFKLDHISAPNYWYIDKKDGARMYRYAFRKSKLSQILDKFDSSKTEVENMIDNGYNYIWDCGNFVFVKDYAY